MPSYIYRCSLCKWTDTRIHSMAACDDKHYCQCGGRAYRVPQKVRLNWDGIPPSMGEMSPVIKKAIEDAPRNRAEFEEIHEAHEKQTASN